MLAQSLRNTRLDASRCSFMMTKLQLPCRQNSDHAAMFQRFAQNRIIKLGKLGKEASCTTAILTARLPTWVEHAKACVERLTSACHPESRHENGQGCTSALCQYRTCCHSAARRTWRSRPDSS